MKIVLDTNTLVSAFLSNRGAPAQVLEALRQEAFELVVSEAILDEYQQVLGYEKVQILHQMDGAEITEVIDALKGVAIIVEPRQSLAGVVRDPDDTKFLECALAGNALYIVIFPCLSSELHFYYINRNFPVNPSRKSKIL